MSVSFRALLDAAQPELSDIDRDRDDDNPSKTVGARCLSGGNVAGFGFFREP